MFGVIIALFITLVYFVWNLLFQSHNHSNGIKLFIAQLQFLTDKVKDKDTPLTIFYKDSAPGNHIGILTELFPSTKWILTDNKPFLIRFSKTGYTDKNTKFFEHVSEVANFDPNKNYIVQTDKNVLIPQNATIITNDLPITYYNKSYPCTDEFNCSDQCIIYRTLYHTIENYINKFRPSYTNKDETLNIMNTIIHSVKDS